MMDNKNYFGNYTLSQKTLDNLKELASFLKHDLVPADDAWYVIKPKTEAKEVENVIEQEARENIADEMETQLTERASTQFFFSQKEQNSNTKCMEVVSEWLDVAELLLESLEKTNDTRQLVYMKNLSDQDVENVIKYLSEKLSLKGTYNLCHSICDMDVDESMRYIRITCSNLLLQKIITLENPSRLMNTVIHELVKKFPDDIQEFIFAPLINADIQDPTIFLAIIDSYALQQRNDLILNFVTCVEELKKWHVTILSQVIISKILDGSAKEKLLDLLLDKASTYSCDKNYGKFVLSFIKSNNPVTDNQKLKLTEIVAVNETIFKRAMENLLKNMYNYGDLWHIA